MNEASLPRPLDPRHLLRHALRTDFVTFIGRCLNELDPGVIFSANWHIEAMAYRLEQVRRGDLRRLIITMPPRSLKSITASVAFPAFIHGHDPTQQIICVSYAQDLASKHQNDYRKILRSDWYRDAFPNSIIDRTKDTEIETLLTRRGNRLATSTGGTLTGRGGNVIVIDDPLKAADAASESKRGAANEWFKSTLLSRLNDKVNGAIVIVTQRLHVDDLVGHLQEINSEEWTVLNLPAIAPRDEWVSIGENRCHFVTAGDVLHPDREPAGVLEELRRNIGSMQFAAQYLQEPVPAEGTLFKRRWIERYKTRPAADEGMIIQSWDTAAKTGEANDYSVCVTVQIIDGRHYLLDVFRDKLEYTALLRHARALVDHYNPAVVLVEDTNIGTALASQLKTFRMPAKAVPVKGDKFSRAMAETVKFEFGDVLLPHSARWLDDFEAELLSFPGGKHDDQVDALTQALAYKHCGGSSTGTYRF